MEQLLKIDIDIEDKEEFKEIKVLYDKIIKLLRNYKDSKILSWEKEIQQSSEQKLKQPLLTRDPKTNTL